MLTGARVLMTVDAVGGIWTYALDLAGGLAGHGARVTLAVLGPAVDGARRGQAEARGLAVVDTGAVPEWLADGQAEVATAAAQVARLAREVGADLVHLNHPVLAGLAPLPCPAVGVAHSCVATWWAAVRGTPLPPDFAWRADLVGRGYRAVDALVAPSRSFAEATRRAYALPVSPRVVHNGRAAPARAAAGSLARALFSAGRLWDEGKGIAVLDAAAAQLPCPVDLAGPLRGPNGAAVVVRHAQALGSLDEAAMAERFATRPIYAAPAFYEPFGLAVVEAAQAGCALLLGDIPTFRELWDGAASFVPPGDAGALAAAARALLDDPARRADLGRAAAARAARYGLDAMVGGTAAVHETVLAGRRVAEAPAA